jgi:DNA-binding transcriptional ArsR family regulator
MTCVDSDTDRCELLCIDVPVAERVRKRIGQLDLADAADSARALGDPTRLRIGLALTAEDELCVCDLAWIVGRSDKLISHHLRVLREAGLADNRRDRKIVFYRLTDRGRRLLSVLVPETFAVSA